jgi:hypothetical protein
VKISSANTLLAASEKPDATYFNIPSGYAYVRFTGVDPTKCAITVTPSAVGASPGYPGLFAGYSVYSGYILAYLEGLERELRAQRWDGHHRELHAVRAVHALRPRSSGARSGPLGAGRFASVERVGELTA